MLPYYLLQHVDLGVLHQQLSLVSLPLLAYVFVCARFEPLVTFWNVLVVGRRGCSLPISGWLVLVGSCRHRWLGRWKYEYLSLGASLAGSWRLFADVVLEDVIIIRFALHVGVRMVELNLRHFDFVALLPIFGLNSRLPLDRELLELYQRVRLSAFIVGFMRPIRPLIF